MSTLFEKMKLDRIARAIRPAPVEEIVKEMPTGFFIMRTDRGDFQMHNGALGCIGPVKSSFWCGGKLYSRERDKHDELTPLKVWIRPRPVFQEYGNFERNGVRIIDSETFGFNGEYEYAPMK